MWQLETELSQVINRAPGVKSFRFPINSANITYQAGQYFYITIKVNGSDALHHFSFSSSPAETGYIEFTKRITDSEFSQTLDNVKPGAWALLEGPEGDFTLPDSADEYSKLAFISGGIGITPLRSMMHYVKHNNLPYQITLLYGNNTEADIIFHDEFNLLSQSDNIKIKHFLTGYSGNESENIIKGYIDKQAISQTIPDYPERLFYISGPPSMLNNIYHQLLKLKVPEKQVKIDAFTGYQ